jgi:hypothetical protein
MGKVTAGRVKMEQEKYAVAGSIGKIRHNPEKIQDRLVLNFFRILILNPHYSRRSL